MLSDGGMESIHARDGSRFVPSQWEKALLCNDVSHWLGASLESALRAKQIVLPPEMGVITKNIISIHISQYRLLGYWYFVSTFLMRLVLQKNEWVYCHLVLSALPKPGTVGLGAVSADHAGHTIYSGGYIGNYIRLGALYHLVHFSTYSSDLPSLKGS